MNDRLQERLAKAVVRANSPKPPESTGPTPRTSTSRPGTPLGDGEESERPSLDKPNSTDDFTTKDPTVIEGREDVGEEETIGETIEEEKSQRAPSILVSEHAPPVLEVSSEPILQNSRPPDGPDRLPPASEPSPSIEDSEALAKLQAEHEEAEKRWQEELHGYVERMDAMQSKLLYLTKETSSSANAAATKAPAGSLEKKLLERDEKIALLMEEGQKLSKTELNHMTTIKKLRTQANEGQKVHKDLRLQVEKAEKEKQTAIDRALRAEAAIKKVEELAATSAKNDREFDAVVKERNALNATIADMKSQLARALARAEAAENKAQSDALERERRHVVELKDDLSSQKIEFELRETKLRREAQEVRDNLEREKEVSRSLEAELRGEQSVMESKIESLRSRAEEVTSGGHSQAKLLRQIEILQTQYAVASENWQGIESSLESRLANAEKERDEVLSREEDLRRKARDANVKAKRFETDLIRARESIEDLEKALGEKQTDIDRLARQLRQHDEEISSIRRDFNLQYQAQEASFSQRLEDEKPKWREQTSTMQYMRTESPVTSLRKNSGVDLPYLNAPVSERPISRRSSALHSHLYESNTPPRQNSLPSVNRGMSQQSLETPSIQSFDHDEAFSGPVTPLSPPNGVNDLISVSTVGAGPSVQLVERMSANVRRLESERAASKDELARLTAQRDEARGEVVSLMREAEQKRAADERIKSLEEESKKMDDRYQTTLEMLGEKSELVEELSADIADLKKIYRELVDSTMKG